MAWSTIRRATDDEKERLDAAAQRFCERHGIDLVGERAQLCIDCETDVVHATDKWRAIRLARLWRRIAKRTLGHDAEGIAYGYVGYHVD